jgi:predicted nucleic acid-binding protein
VIRTVMIDTMVFDALHDDPEGRAAVLAAIRFGELRLLTTHVQEDQIAAIRDPVRRKALQKLPRTVVPSAVRVEGVTRTGRARVSVDSPYARMREMRHYQDGLIADASAARADLLVTDDRRLAREAFDLGNDVWSSAELLEWAISRQARRA